MNECQRRLKAAKELYVHLAIKPERERLLVFDVRTSKWSATRVKAREQHMAAMKRAEREAGEIFESEIERRTGLRGPAVP